MRVHWQMNIGNCFLTTITGFLILSFPFPSVQNNRIVLVSAIWYLISTSFQNHISKVIIYDEEYNIGVYGNLGHLEHPFMNPHNQNYWLNKYFKYSLLIIFKQALILTVTSLWMCTPVYREPGWLIHTVTEDVGLVLG